MPDIRSAVLIAVAAVITAILRFLPFFIFGGKRKTPEFITYLGKVLPFAIMAMLVVFCLKNVSITAFPHGIPELISVAAVALLHIWKRNTLLSIIGGTVLYILLINFIFI
ncbi:MAG: branched-chain amino acid transporter AzlD [Ruminococcaceae bacterium]|nr:branched-chain amino acid transporter AzlD [Oscillospiraceae bacterium]